jgi:hypothetical protein
MQGQQQNKPSTESQTHISIQETQLLCGCNIGHGFHHSANETFALPECYTALISSWTDISGQPTSPIFRVFLLDP